MLAKSSHQARTESGTDFYRRALGRLHDRALPLRRYSESLPDRLPTGDPFAPDGLESGADAVNMLLVGEGADDWKAAAADLSGSPDYLKCVSHANREEVVYVRAVQNLALSPVDAGLPGASAFTSNGTSSKAQVEA